ncbi:MAG: type II toxin-antitoxin system prevent-host-death family antitoxin [Gemmatimonadota bacterium]|nr:type II toxin-antitoxin system prevent-host-death family antitoxin [Gemmatimonadota bacterium]
MRKTGAFEARTHLPQLLRRVAAGERFVITRYGRPVAELIPFRATGTDRIRAAIDDLKAFQATLSLGGLSIREMIEQGRSR